MNIVEAIRSGKRIKRNMWPEFKHYENHYGAKYTAREDILADDWEVESTPVTITREQFDAAWRRAEDVCENMEIKTRHYLYELVVRELGL